MRAAIVTGAGRGIGRAIAFELSTLGYSLGLAARTESELLQTRDRILDGGGRAIAVPCDVTHEGAVQILVDVCRNELGPLHAVVAAAGQARSSPIERTTEDDLLELYRANVVSVFHLIKASSRRMIEDGVAGRIVVVASTAATKAFRYTTAYTASKHAVLGLVRASALELARKGITVNAICPGWVDTQMFDTTLENIASKTGVSRDEAKRRIVSQIPLGDVLSPEEVAASVRPFLADEGKKLTGQALVLDGGETL
ncbi:MAG: SDR family oxidoreductase [Deltaproteobacteria bacterium]|nr:SDR family oxidoreductase [Deltaproteobacteria bacterium]